VKRKTTELAVSKKRLKTLESPNQSFFANS